MPLDALRNHDAPPLRPDLLAAGDTVRMPPTRRQARAMRWVMCAFWLLFAAALAARMVWEGLR
jgi:hypothetical protein